MFNLIWSYKFPCTDTSKLKWIIWAINFGLCRFYAWQNAVMLLFLIVLVVTFCARTGWYSPTYEIDTCMYTGYRPCHMYGSRQNGSDIVHPCRWSWKMHPSYNLGINCQILSRQF